MTKIEVKKLCKTDSKQNTNIYTTTQEGIFYMKAMKQPLQMLADVFFSKLALLMGCNAAKNELVLLEDTEKQTINPRVGSKSFLEKGQVILSFENFNNLSEVGADKSKIYFSKGSKILQDINLQIFFKHYMKDMPKTFREAFINEWWLRTYFRDADQYQSHNMAVVYKNSFRKRKEAMISPAHDFEYCMLSDAETMKLSEFADKNIKIMEKGLQRQNVGFLKREYRDLSENFLGSVEKLRNSPEFDSLCEFSHLI